MLIAETPPSTKARIDAVRRADGPVRDVRWYLEKPCPIPDRQDGRRRSPPSCAPFGKPAHRVAGLRVLAVGTIWRAPAPRREAEPIDFPVSDALYFELEAVPGPPSAPPAPSPREAVRGHPRGYRSGRPRPHRLLRQGGPQPDGAVGFESIDKPLLCVSAAGFVNGHVRARPRT
jgi:hypothetical protein